MPRIPSDTLSGRYGVSQFTAADSERFLLPASQRMEATAYPSKVGYVNQGLFTKASEHGPPMSMSK
jgi:hypothetical protein